MDTQEPKGEDQARNPSEAGFKDMAVQRYNKIKESVETYPYADMMVVQKYKEAKENAESYPYVWGSYIFVYGTLGLWLAYRWRKLRKMEDRVRALQDRYLRQCDYEQSAAKSAQKTPPTDKSSK